MENLKLPRFESTTSLVDHRHDPPRLKLSQMAGGQAIRHGKEWSTIRVTEGALCLPNVYKTIESTSEPKEQQTICYLIAAAETASARDVIVLTGSRRRCSGKLLKGNFHLRLPSGDFVLTWMIQLDHINGKHTFSQETPVLTVLQRTGKGRLGLLGDRQGIQGSLWTCCCIF